ncbi:sushi, nidogen and egf-like domain-containing protein 1 [Plakobranchus ocellatus]|uniref:Sushi, nidogen and egf-like domain-containing protein 1 n=1 Tax=Plakobranchus ocellatus TaxID=259542 RepID=A0AAV4DJQ9_9GAST|nr:sushi, nidogen and egf-like domain-containing protein 1 [Plakobranchus ocellatus]
MRSHFPPTFWDSFQILSKEPKYHQLDNLERRAEEAKLWLNGCSCNLQTYLVCSTPGSPRPSQRVVTVIQMWTSTAVTRSIIFTSRSSNSSSGSSSSSNSGSSSDG